MEMSFEVLFAIVVVFVTIIIFYFCRGKNSRTQPPEAIPASKNVSTSPVASDTPSEDNSDVFSVATYNTLGLLKAALHRETPPAYLEFNYRKPLLQEVLASFKSDFISLQEVDQYEEFFKPVLESLGYQSNYAKRLEPSEDGSVLAWRHESWSPIKFERVEYNDHPEAHENPDYKRNNVGIIGAFKHNISQREVIVIGTHFYWDPEFDYVKYAQAQQLLQIVKVFTDSFPETPVVIAGDFNSLPDSNVVAYFYGQPPKPEENCDCFPQVSRMWREGLPSFKSAYANYDNGRHPPFTNYTYKFIGTLDYIFYSPNLKLVDVSKLVTTEEATAEGCLPNSKQPSDHIPLVAWFQ